MSPSQGVMLEITLAGIQKQLFMWKPLFVVSNSAHTSFYTVTLKHSTVGNKNNNTGLTAGRL